MDEDEIHTNHHHSEFSSTKPRNGTTNNVNSVGSAALPPATSVHELLECPVCTNSMYPPIHQVSSFSNFFSSHAWVRLANSIGGSCKGIRIT